MPTPKEELKPLYNGRDRCREFNLEETSCYRTSFRRDYARVLHSPAFRRLQGKTQLFPGWESDFFRNRLTHSLEVAQIAKSIALRLNKTHPYFQESSIDLDLVETAALAHDLGHPPFGHNGEKALNRCMKRHGGFEGNAQTLRILSRLEKRHEDSEDVPWTNGADARVGLNLTHRSLAAVLKYDKKIPSLLMHDTQVKGYYRTESELVKKIKKSVLGDQSRTRERSFKTIECQIMDIADDIAYSTYDLEDALKAGFITPMKMIWAISDERILKRLCDKPELRALKLDKDTIQSTVVDLWIDQGLVDLESLEVGEASLGDKVERALMVAKVDQASRELSTDGAIRTTFTSELIRSCVESVEVSDIDKVPALSRIELEPLAKNRVEILKHLTYELIIQSPLMKTTEYRGAGIVTEIFEALAGRGGERLLPDDYQALLERSDDCLRKRTICDFVAGMTDRYALEFYARLKSESPQTIFKPL